MELEALRCSGNDPGTNLAIEEALLREGGGAGSRGLFLLYVNGPCVVIGRNQNPWAEVAPGAGLPVLRRISGGGAVYHDLGNLNWSFIVPRHAHDRDAELELVASAVSALGVPARPGPRGGLFAAEGPFAGRKLSGTARRLEADLVLHHGTLLVEADLVRLRSSLGGIEVMESRGMASVPGEPVNLREIAPVPGLGRIAEALARSIAGSTAAPAEPRADPALVEAARLRHAAWEWIWGETPTFAARVAGRAGPARVVVRGGRVSQVPEDAAPDVAGLMGARFVPAPVAGVRGEAPAR